MWLEIIVKAYDLDAFYKDMVSSLALSHSNNMDFTLADGVLKFKGCIWIPDDREIQHNIISVLHDSAVGGHSGFYATYHRIKRYFAWHNVKTQVKTFVQQCTICQQAKIERIAPAGLLQPLNIPDQAWAVVSLDFIEGLSKSSKYDTILVIVDKFSKYAHSLPLTHPFTALTVAKLYMNNIFKLRGLPQAIVSDRDKVFTSSLWQELFKLTKTELRRSSSYHLQTYGQNECVNQCLEAYLRCSVHSCAKNCSHWLPLAEYWYNTTYHSALGMSPFEVVYGQKPRESGVLQLSDCSVPDLASWLKERELMQELLQQQLYKAQNRMKQQADKHRTERTFSVGDLYI